RLGARLGGRQQYGSLVGGIRHGGRHHGGVADRLRGDAAAWARGRSWPVILARALGLSFGAPLALVAQRFGITAVLLVQPLEIVLAHLLAICEPVLRTFGRDDQLG